MEKFAKKTFTLRDAYPYILLAAVTLTILGVLFAKLTWMDVPRPAILVIALTVLGIGFVIARHFLTRWIYVTNWNDLEQLGYGAALVSDLLTPEEEAELIERLELCQKLRNVVVFWSVNIPKEATVQDHWLALWEMEAALEGATVNVVEKPFRVKGILVGGSQDGQELTVVGPPEVTEARFVALLQEEVTHLCLTSLGVPASEHHRIMVGEGFFEGVDRA